MKNRIRLLQVINSAARGGGTQHLKYLVRALDPSRFEVHICISPDGPCLDEFRGDGYPVHPIDMMASRWQSRAARELSALIREVGPELVHLHGTRAAFFVTRSAGEKRNSRMIYTVHGLSYNKKIGFLKEFFYRRIEKSICARVDAVISVSETDGREMVQNGIVGPEKLVVIPNGVDLKRFLSLPLGRTSPTPAGVIARLTEQKGIPHFLDALALLKNEFGLLLDAVIVGDGPLKESLQSQAARLQIGAQIEWAGSVDDPLPFYRRFGIFVLPSLWEGFPLVLLEAMASGVPVVATDTSGGSDIVAHRANGLLVRRGDPRSLALAVKELHEDRVLAQTLARSGREETAQKYSLEKFVSATEKVYDRLLKGM